LLDCKTLTLTELGRNLPTKARTKHNIKRIDRLLGNRHLHKERLAVYRWHASFICSGNTMPIVLVDWSDIREQKRLMVLRASVALHGRSVTLYEKAFPLSEQCSKKAHDQFLADLASILPSNTTPLIVSDAGFKVPWYKSVEKLGWYWLSRVRGKVQYADLGAENWKPISNLHDMSSSHSKTLGYKRLTKSNPISCQILLYKSRSKGRKNQRSTRTHCHHPSPKIYSASAKEPWILATNLPVEIRTPKQLVNIYSKRMQIEETFRDLKSPAYGLGLRHSRTSSSERFDIMLLIALMLQLTCWLAGVHAQKQGWDKHFQANTVRNRNVLSTVRLGMEVLRHSGYTITREDSLGYKRLTKSNPISCQILLYKSRSKGRKNQRSTRTHCHHPSPKIYSASAKEPWILATNLPVEIRTPKQLVNIYSKRMQIEETFRDLKSPAYGLGLRHSRTSSSERFDIMLLIALMLQLTCWLAGVHAQKQGWDKHFQANTVRNRNVLSTVRLGMEVLRHSGYTITREDSLVAATLLTQNLFTHGYVLGKL
ncbi:IS4 family transposase, partial [Escherichia sp. 364]|uniref:IS4 family transposase n=1 Tax=Escherichia sp. 364 TaxID=3435635 RepID=UPI003F677F6B